MKRTLIALLVAGAVFGAVYGMAATLNVSTSTLGEGSSAVAACQATPLTVSYATSYQAGSGYKVGVVTVGGLAAGCYTKPYKIVLTGTAEASLGELTGTTPGSGTSFTADFTAANVAAASVLGVHLVISG
jgi:hypothetical protein